MKPDTVSAATFPKVDALHCKQKKMLRVANMLTELGFSTSADFNTHYSRLVDSLDDAVLMAVNDVVRGNNTHFEQMRMLRELKRYL